MARPRVHAAATIAGLGLLRQRLDWPQRLAFVTGGVLVDADHLIDLVLHRQAGMRRRLVLPLHGWEYVAVMALARGAPRWLGLARAAALGLLLHLLIDQVTNRPGHPALYSVLYRLRHGFCAARLGFRGGDGRWMDQSWWEWF